MRRLYLHVYLAFVGILVLFGLLASVAWFLFAPAAEDRRLLDGLGALAAELLPGSERPASEQQAALERLAQRLPVHLALYAPDRTWLAGVGKPLPPPRLGQTESNWVRVHRGPLTVLHLPDGRWLVARHTRVPGHGRGGLAVLALLAGAIAIGAYPVARRIARRLERLRARVDDLGRGDWKARVEVEGSDEVADLARSFNRAAERIERLVGAQKVLLASVSHELRSPLARIRMGLELLGGEARPELRARLAQDIAELDELIAELLLASRLDALPALERSEEVDLLGLLAEEGARSGAEVRGEPVRVTGDPRLLRRLVRNLLDNGRRYGGDAPVEAWAVPLGAAGARLSVLDRGPGVPDAERERIFEPFYRPAGVPETADGGIGLGLALVRQIARAHGGDARCRPREGGGTCFEVDLQLTGAGPPVEASGPPNRER